MSENVDNLVLEQLRLIRERLEKIEESMDNLEIGQQSHTGILLALGRYIHHIDERVELIEEKLGA